MFVSLSSKIPAVGCDILRLACTCGLKDGEVRFFTELSLVGETQF